MLIKDYSAFVQLSDETRSKSLDERKRIARYGIASEIGSLVAAVKKRDLTDPAAAWNRPNSEIVEELGDIIWYTVMSATLEGSDALDILMGDLAALPNDIEKDEIFKNSLDQIVYARFLQESKSFLSSQAPHSFDDYMRIAILTARTSGPDLLHVCLTRLFLYATVMMSHGFPQVEKLMQPDILKLDLTRCLGMVMWHVSALTNILGLSLDDVVAENRIKLNDLANFDASAPTPLHDGDPRVPNEQRLPRQFEV